MRDGDPVQTYHYSNKLYISLLHHFGSLEAARRKAGVLGPQSRNRRWTKPRVIAELQRLHQRGIRLTDRGLVKAGARGLVNASRTHFGSLSRARRRAGILAPAPLIIERGVWDEETVIAEIRALRRAGKSLAATKAPPKLVSAGIYRFGSWRGAVEVAGFDYDRVRLVRKPYERGELLNQLRTLAATAPEMSLAELWRHPAIEAWNREFGSVEAAAQAAGLVRWPKRKLGPMLSRDEVVAAIRERYRAGRSLAGGDVDRDDGHHYRSALRHFGSWRAAVQGRRLPADAKAQLRRHWTKATVLEALRVRRRAGMPMNPAAVRADEPSLYQAAKIYLGYNANVAVRDWGAPQLQTKWTKRAVIEALRASHERGESPRGAVMLAAIKLFGSVPAAREAGRMPLLRTVWTNERVVDEIRALGGEKPSTTLVSTAQRLFGSWRAALDAAGVPAKLRPRWEPTEIAAALQKHARRGLALYSTTVRRENRSLYDAIRNRWGRGRVDTILARFAKTASLPYLPPPPRRGRPSHRLRA